MDAHDYQGDSEACGVCQRPPGNYLHAGLSGADMQALGWRERKLHRPLSEVIDPPQVLMEDPHA